MKKTFLVFSAHPDDLDFGCAGTVAKLTGQGNRVIYCIVANGEKGTRKVNKSKSEMVKLRRNEQRKAAGIVGVKEVIFLNEIDGEVENTKSLRKKLVRVVRRVRPEVVFSFDPASAAFNSFPRYHRDHRMTAEAVFDSLYPAAGSKAFFPNLKEKPQSIKEAWFYASLCPNLWVDITDTVQKKIKALLCHESQVVRQKKLKEMIFKRARENGKKKKVKYAESFRRLEL